MFDVNDWYASLPPVPSGLVDSGVMVSSQSVPMSMDSPGSVASSSQQQQTDGDTKPKEMKEKKPSGKPNRGGKKSAITEEQRLVKDKERRNANNQRERFALSFSFLLAVNKLVTGSECPYL